MVPSMPVISVSPQLSESESKNQCVTIHHLNCVQTIVYSFFQSTMCFSNVERDCESVEALRSIILIYTSCTICYVLVEYSLFV